MKLVYQYMAIFFIFSLTSIHLHPLQVENCDSNSRLVVDEDDNGKFRIERVKLTSTVGYNDKQKISVLQGYFPATGVCYIAYVIYVQPSIEDIVNTNNCKYNMTIACIGKLTAITMFLIWCTLNPYPPKPHSLCGYFIATKMFYMDNNKVSLYSARTALVLKFSPELSVIYYHGLSKDLITNNMFCVFHMTIACNIREGAML